MKTISRTQVYVLTYMYYRNQQLPKGTAATTKRILEREGLIAWLGWSHRMPTRSPWLLTHKGMATLKRQPHYADSKRHWMPSPVDYVPVIHLPDLTDPGVGKAKWALPPRFWRAA